MSPNDLAIVVPIVAAAISFFAAVVAVVVGQALGQRSQRAADERRWQREDVLRRRTRGEEVARQAIEQLAKAADLVGWTAGWARGASTVPKGAYVSAATEDVSALCRPVRRAALEVEDEVIRAHLEKVCDLLPNSGAAQAFGAPHPARIGWAAQGTSEALVSAYLRGVSLPTPLPEVQARQFKVFNRAYSAMEDFWAELDEGEDLD